MLSSLNMEVAANPARELLIRKRDFESSEAEKAKANSSEWLKKADAHNERVKLLNEIIAEMSEQSLPGPTLNGLGKYFNMTTREGILDVLSQPGAGIMSGSQIASRLLAEGGKSKSPFYKTIVHTECNRLVKMGRLERTATGFKISSRAPAG